MYPYYGNSKLSSLTATQYKVMQGLPSTVSHLRGLTGSLQGSWRRSDFGPAHIRPDHMWGPMLEDRWSPWTSYGPMIYFETLGPMYLTYP